MTIDQSLERFGAAGIVAIDETRRELVIEHAEAGYRERAHSVVVLAADVRERRATEIAGLREDLVAVVRRWQMRDRPRGLTTVFDDVGDPIAMIDVGGYPLHAMHDGDALNIAMPILHDIPLDLGSNPASAAHALPFLRVYGYEWRSRRGRPEFRLRTSDVEGARALWAQQRRLRES